MVKANEKKQDFYNKESKLLWLNSFERENDYFVDSIFSSASFFEREIDLDLCNFPKDRILLFYSNLFSTSADRLNNVNSMLKQYTDWCLLNDMVEDGMNHYLEIDYEDLIRCINKAAINKSYITRRDLINWSCVDNIDNSIINPCDLAIIWLLFEGVRGTHYNEILNVSYDDFNEEDNTVSLISKRRLLLSKECFDFVKKTENIETYVLPSLIEKHFIDNKVFRSYRKDQVNRDDKNDIILVNRLNRRVVNALKDLGVKNATLKSVIVSGQIEYIKLCAKQAKLNVEDYVNTGDCYKKIYERYGVKTFSARRFYASNVERFKED